jgi:hypothetical protein
MAIIHTTAYVPDDLAKDWLQHLRDFDAKHPQCHFAIVADAPDMTLTQLIDVTKITPALDFTAILPGKEQAQD